MEITENKNDDGRPGSKGAAIDGPIEEIIQRLPPDLKQEVYDFALFLLEKRAQPKQRRLKMKWAGGLREFRDQYTSLELQKKAMQWWGTD
jgi:hypothetical protein